ncbi:MAG TPA: RhuM family protein [Acidobacteriota bacterium]|nr:RhuM family protein [Acidobacteriota bacterium]HNT16392.1 RhuM family protein [Acidobacteriota bacterium]
MKEGSQDTQIVIYQSDDGRTSVDVRFQGETAWLAQSQLVDLFQTSKANVSEHIKHIFEEKELDRDSVVRKFRTTAADGKAYEVEHYNLDMIISLGYRIKSSVATRFRIWATTRLREYIVKGFTVDSDRLKKLGGGNYWKDLLDEIRDIRSSEKVLYRQVLDLYATAIDYDPRAEESLKFFKIVQNKLHYAAHGHTAAEVIYLRVDSDRPFAGLRNFKGLQPTQAEAMVAKNFLELSELKVLNNLVSAYFDLAEINAMEHKPMKMADYIRELDNILRTTGRKLLGDAGTISHEKAAEKAALEFRKYKAKNLSEVEKAYLDAIKDVQKKVEKKVPRSRKKDKTID